MASLVRIPIGTIVNPEGQPIKTVKRDEDGEMVWKKECATCHRPAEGTEPELEDLDTLGAVRNIIYALNGEEGKKVRKNDDGMHLPRVFAYVSDARKERRATLRLPEGEHEWLQKLFDRVIPLSKEKKEAGEEPQTLGGSMWGVNAWAVQKQLTPGGLPKIEIEPDPEEDYARNGANAAPVPA